MTGNKQEQREVELVVVVEVEVVQVAKVVKVARVKEGGLQDPGCAVSLWAVFDSASVSSFTLFTSKLLLHLKLLKQHNHQ